MPVARKLSRNANSFGSIHPNTNIWLLKSFPRYRRNRRPSYQSISIGTSDRRSLKYAQIRRRCSVPTSGAFQPAPNFHPGYGASGRTYTNDLAVSIASNSLSQEGVEGLSVEVAEDSIG